MAEDGGPTVLLVSRLSLSWIAKALVSYDRSKLGLCPTCPLELRELTSRTTSTSLQLAAVNISTYV
jgi:hypothetical protein